MQRLLFFALVFFYLFNNAYAQKELSCNRLHEITGACEKGVFDTLFNRALRKGNKGRIQAPQNITGNPATLYWDKAKKKIVYNEIIVPESDTLSIKSRYNDLDNAARQLRNCLSQDTNWVFTKDIIEEESVFIYKDLLTRVFLKFALTEEGVELLIYRNAESSAYCKKGDCRQGYGMYMFDNGDIYDGEYFEGKPIGIGSYRWNTSGIEYRGGWLDGKKSGYGVYFRRSGSENRRGYMLNNQFLEEVDSTKIGICQSGNCNNGDGVVFYPNKEVYVGHFKDKLPDGYGMLQMGGLNYYGQFKGGHYDGYGVLYFTEDWYYQGGFKDGKQEGRGRESTKDHTIIIADYKNDEARGSEYTEKGILLRQGKWKKGIFTPDTSADLVFEVAFANSLRAILSQHDNNYHTLRGEAVKGEKTLFKSKKALLLSQATLIAIGQSNHHFVQAIMNAKPMDGKEALRRYNYLVEIFRNCLDEDWKGKEEQKAEKNKLPERLYSFENKLFDDMRIEIQLTNGTLYVTIF